MSLIVLEAIRGRCASFMILTATVSEIFGGQTNSSILVVHVQMAKQLHKDIAYIEQSKHIIF